MSATQSGASHKLDPFQLDAIATRQKGVILCIAVYLLAVVGQFALPADARILAAIPGLLAVVLGAVFVFMLAIKLHGPVVGFMLGVLTLVPLLGLLVLLLINTKATAVLRAHGVKVGVFGAEGAVCREEDPDECGGPGQVPSYLRTPGSSGGPALKDFRG